MGGGDEVDVVATYLLESHHDPSHVREGNAFPTPKMADVIILAENAPEIAVGEKDGPRTMMSDQGGFLAKMGKGARDHEIRPSLADPNLPIQAIDPTPPWAELALPQQPLQELDPLAEFSFFVETDVRRNESHFSTAS
jgi:hypothetical protein